MFGGVAHQAVNGLHGAGEVFLYGDLAAPVFPASGFAVFVVDIDQVDVGRHIQLARAQLAHADHPHLGPFAAVGLRRAVALVQLGEHGLAGHIQGQLGQLRHGAGHHFQRGGLFAVQHHQAFHHQLAQDAQRRAGVVPLVGQALQRLAQRRRIGRAGRKQGQFIRIAAAQALNQPRMLRGSAGRAVAVRIGCG